MLRLSVLGASVSTDLAQKLWIIWELDELREEIKHGAKQSKDFEVLEKVINIIEWWATQRKEFLFPWRLKRYLISNQCGV